MGGSRHVYNTDEGQKLYVIDNCVCHCVLYMLFSPLLVLWSTCMGGSSPVYNTEDGESYILLTLLCGIHVFLTIVVTLELLHWWLQVSLQYR